MPPRTIPISGKSPDLIYSSVNMAWGREGAGSPEIWKALAPMTYRDSIALGAQACSLQSKDGYYLLYAMQGTTAYEIKGRFEHWNIGEGTGVIEVGPMQTYRVEAPATPIELSVEEDPSGALEGLIRENYGIWGDLLPFIAVMRLMINGRSNEKETKQLCYDGEPLFSTAHKINHMAKLGKAAGTRSNLLKLSGAIDESGWAKAKDLLFRFPDLDGERLPNVGLKRPLVMVPSEQLWLRWAHFLGGPNVVQQLIQQGLNAGISSVYVGNAELMHNPYLVTLAETSGLNFDPEKRSYVFSNSGRKPFILRESETPRLVTQDVPSQNAKIIGARARLGTLLGEYRGVIAIDEK